MDIKQELIESRNGNDQSNDVQTPPIGLGKRRGRPPGSTNKNRPIDLEGKKEPVSSRAESDEENFESAKFIGAAAVSIVELLETLVHNTCEKRIDKKRPEKSEEFRKILEGYKLKDKERELLADSSTKIAVRHAWLTKNAPEVVFGVVLGQYGLRQIALLKFVNNVTGESKPVKKTEEEPAKSPTGGT